MSDQIHSKFVKNQRGDPLLAAAVVTQPAAGVPAVLFSVLGLASCTDLSNVVSHCLAWWQATERKDFLFPPWSRRMGFRDRPANWALPLPLVLIAPPAVQMPE